MNIKNELYLSIVTLQKLLLNLLGMVEGSEHTLCK